MDKNSVSVENEQPLRSPCISVCALNDNDVCTGCFRTGQEISYWGTYDNAQRRKVLALCRERAKTENPFVW